MVPKSRKYPPRAFLEEGREVIGYDLLDGNPKTRGTPGLVWAAWPRTHGSDPRGMSRASRGGLEGVSCSASMNVLKSAFCPFAMVYSHFSWFAQSMITERALCVALQSRRNGKRGERIVMATNAQEEDLTTFQYCFLICTFFHRAFLPSPYIEGSFEFVSFIHIILKKKKLSN